ncbi:hypothetical protein [Nitrosophilus alvini]|uniref:hypothetical protein n=1 Tax=Nitrosophilus alvini TaxID=2714855 RepID=UPI00190BD5BE|nr:hypothetical protein [Nitrosophilus alvini]
MGKEHTEKIEKIIEAVKKSNRMDEEEKKRIIARLEEWREDKNAVRDIAAKAEEISASLMPILAELGFL